jgi:hypothetical protein
MKARGLGYRRLSLATFASSGTFVLLCTTCLLLVVAKPTSAARRKSVSVELLATQSVAPGETAHYPFIVRSAGRLGAVKFDVTGLPPLVSATFVSGGGGRFELSLAVMRDAVPSLSTVTLRVRSSAEVEAVSVYLEIVARTIIVDLDSLEAQDVVVTVGETVNMIIGFGPPVRADRVPSFGVRGLPSGVSVDFTNKSPSTYGFSLTAARSALPGEYQLEVVEFGETFGRSYIFTLRIVDGEEAPSFLVPRSRPRTRSVGGGFVKHV